MMKVNLQLLPRKAFVKNIFKEKRYICRARLHLCVTSTREDFLNTISYCCRNEWARLTALIAWLRQKRPCQRAAFSLDVVLMIPNDTTRPFQTGGCRVPTKKLNLIIAARVHHQHARLRCRWQSKQNLEFIYKEIALVSHPRRFISVRTKLTAEMKRIKLQYSFLSSKKKSAATEKSCDDS